MLGLFGNSSNNDSSMHRRTAHDACLAHRRAQFAFLATTLNSATGLVLVGYSPPWQLGPRTCIRDVTLCLHPTHILSIC
jgi:hypothetical protein